jgi:hypothetical protein
VQLETADVLDGGSLGRALEKCGEALAAADVQSLSPAAELARGHVLDHALAKWADNIDAHGKLLSRMRLTNTSILSTGLLARHR